MPDKPSIIWTLHHRDGRRMEGAVVILNNGHVEAQVISDGFVLYAHSFEVGSQAIEWLDGEQSVWQARVI